MQVVASPTNEGGKHSETVYLSFEAGVQASESKASKVDQGLMIQESAAGTSSSEEKPTNE